MEDVRRRIAAVILPLLQRAEAAQKDLAATERDLAEMARTAANERNAKEAAEKALAEAHRCDGCGLVPPAPDDGSCGCHGRGMPGMLTHARECLHLAQKALAEARAASVARYVAEQWLDRAEKAEKALAEAEGNWLREVSGLADDLKGSRQERDSLRGLVREVYEWSEEDEIPGDLKARLRAAVEKKPNALRAEVGEDS